MNGMKYIIYKRPFDGMEIPVLFPQFLEHNYVAYVVTSHNNLLSAGFVNLVDGKVVVSGKSRSLDLNSRPEDSELIQSHLTFEGI